MQNAAVRKMEGRLLPFHSSFHEVKLMIPARLCPPRVPCWSFDVCDVNWLLWSTRSGPPWAFLSWQSCVCEWKCWRNGPIPFWRLSTWKGRWFCLTSCCVINTTAFPGTLKSVSAEISHVPSSAPVFRERLWMVTTVTDVTVTWYRSTSHFVEVWPEWEITSLEK